MREPHFVKQNPSKRTGFKQDTPHDP